MKYLLFLLLLCTGCATVAHYGKEQAVIVNGSSGFKMDKYIVTANHVVDESMFAYITDYYNKNFLGVVVARDTINDIALITIPNQKFTDYETGSVRAKETVHSIANPSELFFSEVSGEVQHTDRIDPNGRKFIQIGMDTYFGSSGAAILNGRNQIVGMVIQFMPGTRFTMIVPAYKIQLLIQETAHYEPD